MRTKRRQLPSLKNYTGIPNRHTIRIDENRVNIHEQEDQETDPELVKGG